MTKGTSKKPSLPPKKAISTAPKPAQSRAAEQPVGPLTQLLIRARQRILDPRRWSRGAYGRTKTGNICDAWADSAVCWCAVGSLEREAGKKDYFEGQGRGPYGAAHALLEKAAKEITRSSGSITALNDGSGHSAVILMYNKAIGFAKGK